MSRKLKSMASSVGAIVAGVFFGLAVSASIGAASARVLDYDECSASAPCTDPSINCSVSCTGENADCTCYSDVSQIYSGCPTNCTHIGNNYFTYCACTPCGVQPGQEGGNCNIYF